MTLPLRRVRRLLGVTCAILSAGLLLSACSQAAPPASVPPPAPSVTDEPEPQPIVDDLESPSAQPAVEPSAAAPASASASPSAPPTATPRPGAVTTVPILMYHYIRELPANTTDKLGYGLSIPPKVFDQQLAYLQGAGYQSISMDDLVGHIAKNKPLPAKPIVLTFDDGYADFYTAAWPELKKYHFSATAYIVVDFVGRPGYMSWQQLQDLRDGGIEIGAHTMDHVDLSIQKEPQAKHQIDDSRLILQQRLGVPVDTFAYPSGRYNANTVKLVGQAGFGSAVTTAFGARHTAANLLTLSRVRVPGGISMPNFIKNLAG
ncbi:MAG TPA: polysaccharide deacetylase family protein [Chloroflexota bacterium]|nr:polysaccharide deacetylase family protein [Chloroflexota bacterium]